MKTWKVPPSPPLNSKLYVSVPRLYSRSHLISSVLMQEILGNYCQLLVAYCQLKFLIIFWKWLVVVGEFFNSPLCLFTHITFSRVRLLTLQSILLSIESHCNCLNVIYICVSWAGWLTQWRTRIHSEWRQKPMTNCTSYEGKNQAKTLNVRAIKTSL